MKGVDDFELVYRWWEAGLDYEEFQPTLRGRVGPPRYKWEQPGGARRAAPISAGAEPGIDPQAEGRPFSFRYQAGCLICDSESTPSDIGTEQLADRDVKRYSTQTPYLDYVFQELTTLVEDQTLPDPGGLRIRHRYVHRERVGSDAALKPGSGEAGQCCGGADREQEPQMPE